MIKKDNRQTSLKAQAKSKDYVKLGLVPMNQSYDQTTNQNVNSSVHSSYKIVASYAELQQSNDDKTQVYHSKETFNGGIKNIHSTEDAVNSPEKSQQDFGNAQYMNKKEDNQQVELKNLQVKVNNLASGGKNSSRMRIKIQSENASNSYNQVQQTQHITPAQNQGNPNMSFDENQKQDAESKLKQKIQSSAQNILAKDQSHRFNQLKIPKIKIEQAKQTEEGEQIKQHLMGMLDPSKGNQGYAELEDYVNRFLQQRSVSQTSTDNEVAMSNQFLIDQLQSTFNKDQQNSQEFNIVNQDMTFSSFANQRKGSYSFANEKNSYMEYKNRQQQLKLIQYQQHLEDQNDPLNEILVSQDVNYVGKSRAAKIAGVDTLSSTRKREMTQQQKTEYYQAKIKLMEFELKQKQFQEQNSAIEKMNKKVLQQNLEIKKQKLHLPQIKKAHFANKVGAEFDHLNNKSVKYKLTQDGPLKHQSQKISRERKGSFLQENSLFQNSAIDSPANPKFNEISRDNIQTQQLISTDSQRQILINNSTLGILNQQPQKRQMQFQSTCNTNEVNSRGTPQNTGKRFNTNEPRNAVNVKSSLTYQLKPKLQQIQDARKIMSTSEMSFKQYPTMYQNKSAFNLGDPKSKLKNFSTLRGQAKEAYISQFHNKSKSIQALRTQMHNKYKSPYKQQIEAYHIDYMTDMYKDKMAEQKSVFENQQYTVSLNLKQRLKPFIATNPSFQDMTRNNDMVKQERELFGDDFEMSSGPFNQEKPQDQYFYESLAKDDEQAKRLHRLKMLREVNKFRSNEGHNNFYHLQNQNKASENQLFPVHDIHYNRHVKSAQTQQITMLEELQTLKNDIIAKMEILKQNFSKVELEKMFELESFMRQQHHVNLLNTKEMANHRGYMDQLRQVYNKTRETLVRNINNSEPSTLIQAASQGNIQDSRFSFAKPQLKAESSQKRIKNLQNLLRSQNLNQQSAEALITHEDEKELKSAHGSVTRDQFSKSDDKGSLRGNQKNEAKTYLKDVTEEPGFKSSTCLDEEGTTFEVLAGKDMAHFIKEGNLSNQGGHTDRTQRGSKRDSLHEESITTMKRNSVHLDDPKQSQGPPTLMHTDRETFVEQELSDQEVPMNMQAKLSPNPLDTERDSQIKLHDQTMKSSVYEKDSIVTNMNSEEDFLAQEHFKSLIQIINQQLNEKLVFKMKLPIKFPQYQQLNDSQARLVIENQQFPFELQKDIITNIMKLSQSLLASKIIPQVMLETGFSQTGSVVDRQKQQPIKHVGFMKSSANQSTDSIKPSSIYAQSKKNNESSQNFAVQQDLDIMQQLEYIQTSQSFLQIQKSRKHLRDEDQRLSSALQENQNAKHHLDMVMRAKTGNINSELSSGQNKSQIRQTEFQFDPEGTFSSRNPYMARNTGVSYGRQDSSQNGTFNIIMQKHKDPKLMASTNKSGHQTDPETIRGQEDVMFLSKNHSRHNIQKSDGSQSNVEIGSKKQQPYTNMERDDHTNTMDSKDQSQQTMNQIAAPNYQDISSMGDQNVEQINQMLVQSSSDKKKIMLNNAKRAYDIMSKSFNGPFSKSPQNMQHGQSIIEYQDQYAQKQIDISHQDLSQYTSSRLSNGNSQFLKSGYDKQMYLQSNNPNTVNEHQSSLQTAQSQIRGKQMTLDTNPGHLSSSFDNRAKQSNQHGVSTKSKRSPHRKMEGNILKTTTFQMDTLGVKEDSHNISVQGNPKQLVAKSSMIAQANAAAVRNQYAEYHSNGKNDHTRNQNVMNQDLNQVSSFGAIPFQGVTISKNTSLNNIKEKAVSQQPGQIYFGGLANNRSNDSIVSHKDHSTMLKDDTGTATYPHPGDSQIMEDSVLGVNQENVVQEQIDEGETIDNKQISTQQSQIIFQREVSVQNIQNEQMGEILQQQDEESKDFSNNQIVGGKLDGQATNDFDKLDQISMENVFRNSQVQSNSRISLDLKQGAQVVQTNKIAKHSSLDPIDSQRVLQLAQNQSNEYFMNDQFNNQYILTQLTGIPELSRTNEHETTYQSKMEITGGTMYGPGAKQQMDLSGGKVPLNANIQLIHVQFNNNENQPQIKKVEKLSQNQIKYIRGIQRMNVTKISPRFNQTQQRPPGMQNKNYFSKTNTGFRQSNHLSRKQTEAIANLMKNQMLQQKFHARSKSLNKKVSPYKGLNNMTDSPSRKPPQQDLPSNRERFRQEGLSNLAAPGGSSDETNLTYALIMTDQNINIPQPPREVDNSGESVSLETLSRIKMQQTENIREMNVRSKPIVNKSQYMDEIKSRRSQEKIIDHDDTLKKQREQQKLMQSYHLDHNQNPMQEPSILVNQQVMPNNQDLPFDYQPELFEMLNFDPNSHSDLNSVSRLQNNNTLPFSIQEHLLNDQVNPVLTGQNFGNIHQENQQLLQNLQQQVNGNRNVATGVGRTLNNAGSLHEPTVNLIQDQTPISFKQGIQNQFQNPVVIPSQTMYNLPNSKMMPIQMNGGRSTANSNAPTVVQNPLDSARKLSDPGANSSYMKKFEITDRSNISSVHRKINAAQMRNNNDLDQNMPSKRATQDAAKNQRLDDPVITKEEGGANSSHKMSLSQASEGAPLKPILPTKNQQNLDEVKAYQIEENDTQDD